MSSILSRITRIIRCANIVLPILVVSLWVKAFFMLPLLLVVVLIYSWRSQFNVFRRWFWQLPKRVRHLSVWCSTLFCAVIVVSTIDKYVVSVDYVDCNAIDSTETGWQLINKMNYGAIKNGTNISRYYRTFAVSHVRRNDIAIISLPLANNVQTDKTLAAYRVFALPSDSVMISQGFVYVNGTVVGEQPNVTDQFVIRKYTSSSVRQQIIRNALTSTPIEDGETLVEIPLTVAYKWKEYLYSYLLKNSFDSRIFTHSLLTLWNAQNMGPIYVPRKGDTVDLNPLNATIYRQAIEDCEGHKLEIDSCTILLDGVATDRYTFGVDYYWMLGDNRQKSYDSRFFGLVPANSVVARNDK